MGAVSVLGPSETLVYADSPREHLAGPPDDTKIAVEVRGSCVNFNLSALTPRWQGGLSHNWKSRNWIELEVALQQERSNTSSAYWPSFEVFYQDATTGVES